MPASAAEDELEGGGEELLPGPTTDEDGASDVADDVANDDVAPEVAAAALELLKAMPPVEDDEELSPGRDVHAAVMNNIAADHR